MPYSKICPNCGASIEEGTRFCQECGTDLSQKASSSQPAAVDKYTGTPKGEKRAIDHLTIGYTVALEQPMVFLPSIISGVLGFLVSYGLDPLGDTFSLLIGLAVSMVSFILNFASIDMSRDAYYKQPLDLSGSISYVADRFVPFFIAAIFGGLLSITIVLIPVVVFMFVIMVLDETGVMDGFQRSINVLKTDFVDVLVIIVLSIITSVIIGYVPLISTLLDAVVNVIVGIAFIDVYSTYKSKYSP